MMERAVPMMSAKTDNAHTNSSPPKSANKNANSKATVQPGQKIKTWLINVSSHLAIPLLEAVSPKKTQAQNANPRKNVNWNAKKIKTHAPLENALKPKEENSDANKELSPVNLHKNALSDNVLKDKDVNTTMLNLQNAQKIPHAEPVSIASSGEINSNSLENALMQFVIPLSENVSAKNLKMKTVLIPPNVKKPANLKITANLQSV